MTQDPLMITAEVAEWFRVNPKTVTRWVAQKKITSIRTPGGCHRFPESEVRAFSAPDPAENAA